MDAFILIFERHYDTTREWGGRGWPMFFKCRASRLRHKSEMHRWAAIELHGLYVATPRGAPFRKAFYNTIPPRGCAQVYIFRPYWVRALGKHSAAIFGSNSTSIGVKSPSDPVGTRPSAAHSTASRRTTLPNVNENDRQTVKWLDEEAQIANVCACHLLLGVCLSSGVGEMEQIVWNCLSFRVGNTS
jgi:hypothetical protein